MRITREPPSFLSAGRVPSVRVLLTRDEVHALLLGEQVSLEDDTLWLGVACYEPEED